MTAIRVEVTAEQIAAYPDREAHKHWDGPVVDAIGGLTGQQVDVDSDGERGYIATIGQDDWTIVIDLPPLAVDFLDYRWEAWIADLVLDPEHGPLIPWPTDRWGFYCPDQWHDGNSHRPVARAFFTTAEAENGVTPTPRPAGAEPAASTETSFERPDHLLTPAPLVDVAIGAA